MSLLDDIPVGALVALDTMVWIYQFEANPLFGPVVRDFFHDALATGRNSAGSSLLVLGEVLVQPLVTARQDLAERYRQAFQSGAGFTVWDVTRSAVDQAAALRARYRLRMIDALHVASAVVNGAQFFLSNDAGLRRVTELQVLLLSDYTSPPAP